MALGCSEARTLIDLASLLSTDNGVGVLVCVLYLRDILKETKAIKRILLQINKIY